MWAITITWLYTVHAYFNCMLLPTVHGFTDDSDSTKPELTETIIVTRIN